MTTNGKRDERRAQTLTCPVCGRKVTCRATYREGAGERVRERVLVAFECNMEGRCGIPSWDPCPQYVACLEQTRQA